MQPTISQSPITGNFVEGTDNLYRLERDIELGGVGLSDPSQGLEVKYWTVETDGTDITIYADDVPPVVVYTGVNITEVNLAFDSNMNYFVAFVEGNQAKYKWFDSVLGDFTVTSLGATDTTPRCTLDDKRAFNPDKDIILAYVRSDVLYARYQGDRYGIEYTLANLPTNHKLLKIGINDKGRLQYQTSNKLNFATPQANFIRPDRYLSVRFFCSVHDFNEQDNIVFTLGDGVIQVGYKNNTLYVRNPLGTELPVLTPKQGFRTDSTFLICLNLERTTTNYRLCTFNESNIQIITRIVQPLRSQFHTYNLNLNEANGGRDQDYTFDTLNQTAWLGAPVTMTGTESFTIDELKFGSAPLTESDLNSIIVAKGF